MRQQLFFISLFFIILVILTAPVALTQETKEFDFEDPIPMDPKVTIGTLDNGLVYYIRENGRPDNQAIFRLAINAGSILENDDQQGLAHFVEHMAFNGTKNFPKKQLIDYLETTGMRFGPDINAYTGFDETVYKLDVATDEPEVMEKAFQVLEDWAYAISFNPEQIEQERNVIIEEWRLGQGAQSRMRKEYMPVLLKGSRYAQRLPIGKKEIIQKCGRETLIRFYEDWYRPDLTAVIAVGDFDPEEIEQKIRRQFGDRELQNNPPEREEYPVLDHEETLYSVVTDPEATNTVVRIFFKHDTKEYKTVSDYKELMVRGLYNRMFNKRLDELTQQEEPPYVYGFSTMMDMVRTKSMYALACLVPENGVETGLETLMTEATRVRRHGFTEGELERAKKEMLSSYESAYREREKSESVSYAKEYIDNYMEGTIIPGIENEFALFTQLLPNITLEDINGTASSLVTEENRVVLVTGPEKKSVTMPDKETLRRIISRAESKKVGPYKDDVSGASIMERKPIPGTVVREKRYPSLGLEEWTLSNGVTVVLKPTDFKNDEILLSAYSPGGTSVVPDDKFMSAQFASMIVQNSGVEDHSKIQLQKLLAGKKVSVRPFIGELTEGFSGSGSPEDLETLLQLVYLYATSPREDEAAYSSLIRRLKGAIRNRNANPEAAFQDALQKATTENHFRTRPITVDILDEIDMETAYEVYRERFADAGDFTFIFTGAFSMEMVRPLVNRYLAALPSTGREETWRDRGIEFPETTVAKTVEKGIEEKSHVGIAFGGEFDWTRKREYILGSLVEVLDIKLREKIREEAGGTYNVSVQHSVGKYPDEEYEIDIIFGCDPERAEELSGMVLEELKALQKQPLEEIYLTKTKESQRRSYKESQEENSYWVKILRKFYFYDLELQRIPEYGNYIDNLTAEEITGMAEEVFTEHYVKVVLMPE